MSLRKFKEMLNQIPRLTPAQKQRLTTRSSEIGQE